MSFYSERNQLQYIIKRTSVLCAEDVQEMTMCSSVQKICRTFCCVHVQLCAADVQQMCRRCAGDEDVQ